MRLFYPAGSSDRLLDRIEIMTPTLYLLCGLPGSGKTTRAKELEAAGKGILLNADDWVCQLYPDDAEAAARDERKELVEQVQWELAERLLIGGINVILDWGVWMRAQRDHYRKRARELGAIVQTVFIDTPIETLQERVAQRNRNLPPGTFSISAEELNEWAAIFEPPTHEELTRH
jgi:predicted kinase